MTLPEGLKTLQDANLTSFKFLMTGATVAAVPIIIFFLIFQPCSSTSLMVLLPVEFLLLELNIIMKQVRGILVKRFKKSIIAGAVIVGLTALTACGGNNSSSTDVDNWEEWEGKITVWDGPRWEDESENKFHWMEEKVAEFEEKYPGVEVELVQQPWAELGDSLSVAIAGGRGRECTKIIPCRAVIFTASWC